MADPLANMNLTSPYGYSPNLPAGGGGGGAGFNAGSFAPFLNIGGALLNYGTQSNALNTATQAINRGYTQGIDVTQQALQRSQGAFAPYMASGVNALNQLNTPGGVQLAPGYQFAQQAGQEAINAQAASRGQFFSPATMQSLSQFSQENANQFYQQAWQNLFQQSQQGLGATSTQTTQQINLANMLSNLFTGQGTAQAQAAGAGAGAQSSLVGSLASALPSAISAAPAIASLF